MSEAVNVAVLAGGFGGARMADGFALLKEDARLSVIVNTGDDLELHGLHISPDLDTVMYTLAGLSNDETGWGVRDETWSSAWMLGRYGRETWFRLGDRDLATHVARTDGLRSGRRLTEVTADMTRALEIEAAILPMSDDRVRTQIRTAEGWLDFQDYFVRRHHEDEVLELRYDGIEAARPTPEVMAALRDAELIVIAPSNPFLSVSPVLSVPGILDAVHASPAPVMAVSPIVGGKALRGPAALIMSSLGGEPSAAGIARHYAQTWPGLLDVLVVDTADETDAAAIAAEGIRAHVTNTVIAEHMERRRLAQEILELAGAL